MWFLSDRFKQKARRLYATWPEYIGDFFVDVLPSNPIGRWIVAAEKQHKEDIQRYREKGKEEREARMKWALNLHHPDKLDG